MQAKLLTVLLTCAIVVPSTVGASALTQPAAARPATTRHAPIKSPIKHVVVLYLENHSFDNVFGFWCDQDRSRCPDGGMPSSVTLSNGAVVKPRVLPDVVPIVQHTVSLQLAAINGGAMNGWQNVAGCRGPQYRCVSGYKPRQIPNLTSLADSFAMSDDTFSLADSPSYGGHLYAAMGSLDGFLGNAPHSVKGQSNGPGWGCDSDKLAPWEPALGAKTELVPSCVPDPSLPMANGGAFEPTPVSYLPTIFDRMHAAGRTWRIYGRPGVAGKYGSDGYVWDICPDLAECLYTRQHNNNVRSGQFITAAEAGKLPNFSIIVPGGKDAQFSEHNGFSMTAGDDWIGKVASAIMNGPEWDSTALFITYDDCGCFYDQVPPGTSPDGTQQGPRTPLVIVSPYAKAGYTDTTATTFAGILAYTEQNFGLRPLGVNDANAYAFANAFDYSQTPLRPVRMVNRPVPRGDHIIWSQAREDT